MSINMADDLVQSDVELADQQVTAQPEWKKKLLSTKRGWLDLQYVAISGSLKMTRCNRSLFAKFANHYGHYT
jgi:hypothetical protein